MKQFESTVSESGHIIYNAEDANGYEVGNFLLSLGEKSDFSLEWKESIIYFKSPSDVRYFVLGLDMQRMEI